MYGVWWFPTVVIIRLSHPSFAGLGLVWAWAELGKITDKSLQLKKLKNVFFAFLRKFEYFFEATTDNSLSNRGAIICGRVLLSAMLTYNTQREGFKRKRKKK